MGKSYTSFRERGFWARDGMLEVWLRCVALHLDDDCYMPDHWLHAFRDNLLLQSSGMFNGLISPCLDEHLTDETRVAAVIKASDEALAHLQAFGSVVPAAALNALGFSSGIFFDMPLTHLVDIHDTFNALLRGELDPELATTRVLPYPAGYEAEQAMPNAEPPLS